MDIELDLNAVCLTCMCVSPRTLSVLTEDLKHELTLMAMITSISSNVIVSCDGLPTKVCFSCAELLQIAYGFLQTCSSSYSTLMGYLKQIRNGNSTDAEEVASMEDDRLDESIHDQHCLEKSCENVLNETLSDSNDQHDDSILQELLHSNEEYLEEEFLDINETDDQMVETEQLSEFNGSVDEDVENQLDEMSDSANSNKLPTKKYQCPVCNRVLSKHYHLQRHMLTHSTVKPFRCTVCDISFARSDNLQTHLLVHSAERRYSCDICKKSFKKNEHLKNHLVRCHASSNQLNQSNVCTICKRYFAIEANLQKHMESHSQEPEYVCEECGKTFRNKYPYRAHCRIHSQERQKKFYCEHCGKIFQRKEYLTVHLRRHTGENPFKCNYCEKAFPRSSDLKMHEAYHTNIKNHQCSICDKSFFRMCSLRLHMKIHTGDKPYKCPYCPKQFIQKYEMQTHIRRHTGERFKCQFCEKKFVHAHQLKQHAKATHNATSVCLVSSLVTVADTSNQQNETVELR